MNVPTMYLTDQDLLYEMIKEYIGKAGKVNACINILEYDKTPNFTLQFVMDMLINDVKAVKAARLNAMRDADWNEWNSKGHKLL